MSFRWQKNKRVEILKVLFRGAEVLILDEPTAVLTPQEANKLFWNHAVHERGGMLHHSDHPQAS